MYLEKKTAEQIEDLKNQWKRDPIWDIYETPGFEAHKDELKEYQDTVNKEWGTIEARRLSLKAIHLQIPGKIELVKLIESLERKVAELADQIVSIQERF